MDCWQPVKMRNPRYGDLLKQLATLERIKSEYERGVHRNYTMTPFSIREDIEKLNLLVELTPPWVYVPCRKCPRCLDRRKNEWKGRLLRETLYHMSLGRKALFCTFTYSPKYYKKCRETYKKDVATLFDKLRSKYRRSFRHWCIAELGEKTKRYHIHAIIWDVPHEFAPDSHFHPSKNGARMGSNKIIKKCWGKGIVDVGFVKSPSSCTYVIDYITKNDIEAFKNGEKLFKGGIICSNQLGFTKLEDNELERIALAISNNDMVSYKLGNISYSYPQSFLKKLFTETQLRYISFNSKLRNYYLGGEFVLNKRHYGYTEFMEKVSNYTAFSLYKETKKQYSVFEPDINKFLTENLF